MASNKEGLPSLKKDLQNSLLFLQQRAPSGDSLFDHLSNVISKVIDERPKNIADHFELFSERVRLETFRMNGDAVEEGYKEPERLALAKKVLPKLIEKKSKQRPTEKDDDQPLEPPMDDDEDDEGDVIYHEPSTGDLCELQFYWNLLGVGFPREEVFLLSHSIVRLKENPALANCRFWGKMLGLKNDYYVVESTSTESSQENRIDALEEAINIMRVSENSVIVPVPPTTNANTKVENNDDKDNGSDLRAQVEEYPTGWNFSMEVARSQYRPPVEVPAELNGHGVNRHVYYVCNDLNDEWVELPPVTPHQVNVSRRIKKYLTGDLDEPIVSYPSFPGTERNLLRALIARISAGTHISPRHFFQIGSNDGDKDDSEDDDDDGATLSNRIVMNESYRPWKIAELLKLGFWQHHKPEILKQGRASFFDGIVFIANDGGEALSDMSDQEDDSEEANNDTKPETPVPLFAACSGDRLTNDGMSPWTIRLSDAAETLVTVQSHVWPGAYAFVKNRIFDNTYIGYGHKNSSTNYAPPAIPQISLEFPADFSDVREDEDPPFEKEHFIESPREMQDDPVSDSADGVEVDSDQ